MLEKKTNKTQIKAKLHPRNKHINPYDFELLVKASPKLGQYVILNKFGDESIDFFKPKAVKALNTALLKHYYKIENWDIPNNYLCPPIPGRADYIHHIADLLGFCNNGKIPKGNKILVLDIGVGANCVYPIIGNKEYEWSFIGSDIDDISITSAKAILNSNPSLKKNVDLRLQKNNNCFFEGIIKNDEFIDLSICNPPFHSSFEQAQSGTVRKLKNLKQKKITSVVQNFGGQNNELWCEGGEIRFIKDMIIESKRFAKSVLWFSSLVSKESNLKSVYASLKSIEAVDVKTINMAQGNKISRIVAWTFLNAGQRSKWAKTKWK